MEESELSKRCFDEDKLREEYELRKDINAEGLELEEDYDQANLKLMEEMQKFSPDLQEEFQRELSECLNFGKEGEELSFVQLLTKNYKNSLAKTLEDQIFDTLPDHVFWDIKKPLVEGEERSKNKYNSFRRRSYDSFFDFRDYEAYNRKRDRKENLSDAISPYRRY